MIFTQPEFNNELIIYAERYAISRGSYSNGSVADMVLQLATDNELTPKTMTVLKRDIETALHDEVIPHLDQVLKWTDVQKVLEDKLKSLPNPE